MATCNFQNAAHHLADNGFRVFPSNPGTKRPAILGWPQQATTNHQKIDKWAAKWPTHNVSICTTSLVVLDIDGADGHQHLAELQRQHGQLPPTTLHKSPGGEYNQHLIFKLPPGIQVRNNNKTCLKGIDIKGFMGQTIGPGSIHRTGAPYEEVIPGSEMAECPDWLLNYCHLKTHAEIAEHHRRQKAAATTAHDPSTPTPELLAYWGIRDYPIASPGSRYQGTLHFVGSLFGKGYTATDICRAVEIWLKHFEDQYETALPTAVADALSTISKTEKRIKSGIFTVGENPYHYGRPLPASFTEPLEILSCCLTPTELGIAKGILREGMTEIEKCISAGSGGTRTPNTVLGVRAPGAHGIKSLQNIDITYTWGQVHRHMAAEGHTVHRTGIARTGKRLVTDRNNVIREAEKMELFIRTRVATSARRYNVCNISPLLSEIDALSIAEIIEATETGED
jgi:hypothetical protein